MPSESPEPRLAARDRSPLSAGERRRVALAAASPIALTAVVLGVAALLGSLGLADVVWGAVVYGGLLGLAGGFVAVDRLQARRCARCGAANDAAAAVCGSCDYDLVAEPRWACDERHAVYLDPGLCSCGRRLQPMPAARGVGAEVMWTLKFGAWLLAFLVLMGIVLSIAG